MTVQERLCFIRAGYSRADIEAFEAADNFAAAPAADAAAALAAPAAAADAAAALAAPAAAAAPAADAAPVWATALMESINKLTETAQHNNVMFDDMGAPPNVQDAAKAALASYLKGAENTNKGGKK